MREIKFRARAKYNGNNVFQGDWMFGCLIYNLDPYTQENVMAEAYISERLRGLMRKIEVDIKTIGEWTGLKDKNGVEIYEGDIIKARHYIMGSKPAYYENHEVIFRMGCFQVKLYEHVAQNLSDTLKVVEHKYVPNVGEVPTKLENTVEVIGNIHTNPELLKH